MNIKLEYSQASLSGLPTSVLSPELTDLSSERRPKTGVQIAQVVILGISWYLLVYIDNLFLYNPRPKTDVQIA